MSPPQRFRGSLPPSDIVFNLEVAMDLMWIDEKAVLHFVDLEKNFSSATFLPNQTLEGVWDVFVSCWASLYIGFPMKMRVDRRSVFIIVRWTRRADTVGTIVQTSGVESHNSIGSAERYHGPLRRTFNEIKHENQKLNRKIALRIAVKAMNDTLEPNGLVPSYLVFGCVPRFPAVDSKLPNQQSRMDALSLVRQEVAIIVSEMRVQKALTSRVPRNAELKIEPRDKVRIYRETDKKYVGPYLVFRVDNKQLFAVIKDREVQFSVHQAIEPSTYDEIVNGERLVHTLSKILPQLNSNKRRTKPSKKRIIPAVHITEVLYHTDSRTHGPEADTAHALEIENLVRRGTCEMILQEDVPKDANMITR